MRAAGAAEPRAVPLFNCRIELNGLHVFSIPGRCWSLIIAESAPWPSFAESLPSDPVFEVLVDLAAQEDLMRLGALYDANRPDRVAPLEAPSIPKVIHQIWLGSPLPRKLRRYSETWRRQHPDWELKLWTDVEVARLDFPTRPLFESTTCWGQKSDLLRVELLLREGGVYVDLDYECYKPLDPLRERYDFFNTLKYLFTAHMGWPAIWRDPIVVCNSLLGACPGHPVLSRYLEIVESRWHDAQRYALGDDELMPIAIAVMGGREKAARVKETGLRTFQPFGEAVAELAGHTDRRDIVLPPLFFNPVMAGARTLYLMPDFWQRCRADGVQWPSLKTYTRRHQLSMARHISENRWV